MSKTKHSQSPIQLPLFETWKPIPGYEGRYEISDLGRIKRLADSFPNPHKRERIFLQYKTPQGYMNVSFGRKMYLVHRLVMLTFIGPCPSGKQINHKDGDKQNNALVNLEYVTPSENVRHSLSVLGASRAKGIAHGMAKLTEDEVREILRLGHTLSETKIGERFGVSHAAISRILNRKNWRHLK